MGSNIFLTVIALRDFLSAVNESRRYLSSSVRVFAALGPPRSQWLGAVELRRKSETRAGDMFHLLAKRPHFGRPVLWLLIFEESGPGAELD